MRIAIPRKILRNPSALLIGCNSSYVVNWITLPCSRNLYFILVLLFHFQADNADTVNEDEIQSVQEEAYSGLRSQDLQEAKDQLLVDTSDMLKIPLFTAEALLRNNGML